MKRILSLLFVVLLLCTLLVGCAAKTNSGPRIENAKAAIDDKLINVFSGSEQEAKKQLGLTEEKLVEARGEQEVYRFSHLWCGVSTDMTIGLGFDRVGTISGKIVLGDDDAARKSAETGFDLFKAQFGEPYGYTQAEVNYSYTSGDAKTIFEQYWKDAGSPLAFRFYVNDEKSTYEFVEYRIEKNGETQKIEISFMLYRSVIREITDKK